MKLSINFITLNTFSYIASSRSFGNMIRGVGVFRTMQGKDRTAAKEISKVIKDHVAGIAMSPVVAPPVRVTMVTESEKVVLVEEWETSTDYSSYLEHGGDEVNDRISMLLSEPPTAEFFPEALHIFKDEMNPRDVGILVRQKTSSKENGAKLRDAQREAYERQMKFEPGCTCCIILAGSIEDTSQVRIIELWKTMQDFYFHESSEWHSKGEEKVVPLVIDMDCDFVDGSRIIS
mmetsp:Transcript_20077/g.58076  ORF Transcript_20077/g.58076 Transcript_20077/m.58076 type:complete len:233 (-) Transcript_20077:115-813(-)